MTDRPTMKPGRTPAGPPPAAPTQTASILAAAEALTAQVQRIADALEPRAFELVGDERTPPTPTDDDALRGTRRDSLLVLLSRAGRGVLTPDEATLLRHHVEAEIGEADTARAVAAGNKRHVQTIVPEIDRLTAEVETERTRADAAEMRAERRARTVARIRGLADRTEQGQWIDPAALRFILDTPEPEPDAADEPTAEPSIVDTYADPNLIGTAIPAQTRGAD